MERDESQGAFVSEQEDNTPRVFQPGAESAPGAQKEDYAADDESVAVGGVLGALERIERRLEEIRGIANAAVRETRHREFSPARLLASIVQALAAGLVLWALSDWVFGEDAMVMFTKLAFAGVFQLGALTGFMLGREVD